jgi:hypothetical protein
MSSMAFSDFGSDDEEDHLDTNDGDYTTRMDELFADERDETTDAATSVPVPRFDGDEGEEEDEEPFVYDGADAPISRATYREQLRDVLEDEDENQADAAKDDDDDELEQREVERSLVHNVDRSHSPMTIGDDASVSLAHAYFALDAHSRVASHVRYLPLTTHPPLHMAIPTRPTTCLCRYQPSTIPSFSPSSTSTSVSASLSSPLAMSSSLPNGNGIPTHTLLSTPTHLSPPFLHKTVSRLRSYTPHMATLSSPLSAATSAHSAGAALRAILTSPVPSSFSTLSPGSSSSALPGNGGVEKHDFVHANGYDSSSSSDTREVFRWTLLRALGAHLFARQPSNKAQAVLGAPAVGAPTTMVANGLICVGTESGRVLVFDFKQTLRCICGDPVSGAFESCSLNC